MGNLRMLDLDKIALAGAALDNGALDSIEAAFAHPSAVPNKPDTSDLYESGPVPHPTRKKLAVVTCMDARIDPLAFAQLPLEVGDAHIIRNAGGRAADAVRSLIASQRLLGTRIIYVIHHTDCGMASFRDEELRRILGGGAMVETMAFLPFCNYQQAVIDDVQFLRDHPLIMSERVRGYIYDVVTGSLTEVKV
ncbi:carbonic anhydrase [Calocera cornea HHB12733]|uniref:Carbonic anhydrase n=1 Tax=Calocera cornea HHB12733 TaxID=1353952 RepID=A0A165D6B8_9BASI|nr:carbonic anhydrase [Calocera cornea HHB12733]